MHDPSSIAVQDVCFMLYKNKYAPLNTVPTDPWNSTSLAHVREQDVPTLNRIFPGCRTITAARRLAATVAGDFDDDPVPQPPSPGVRFRVGSERS